MSTIRFALLLGWWVGLGGCASNGARNSEPGPAAGHGEVIRVLERQAAAWNKGDMEGFMQGYWRSPDLTFSSGGKVTRGWQPMLDYFKSTYPDRSAMGRLTFSELEVTHLSPDAVLVLGRWRLEAVPPAGGGFSLVFRRLNEQWVIIHDHTSRDAV